MHHKWTLDDLIDQWTLLPNELELVNRSKTAHNRLGAALLLKYFQIDGRFPRRQRDIPQAAVEYVAKQLKISADQCLKYNWQGRMIKIHRAAIRTFLGFREGTTADAEAVTVWLIDHILPHQAKQDSLTRPLISAFAPSKSNRQRQAVSIGWCVRPNGFTANNSVIRSMPGYPWKPNSSLILC